MFKVLSFFLFFLTAASFAGCRSAELESGYNHDKFYIINGSIDESAAHQGVVMINNLTGWCSGTLISPTVVLSAAHCADSDVLSDYEISFGDNWDSFVTRNVAGIVTHPDWDPEPNILSDIALFRIDQPAPDWAIPIPHLPTSLAISPADVGLELEYVGFGRDAEGVIGNRLKITLPIHSVCEDPDWCQATLGQDTYWARPDTFCRDQESGGPCSGDSGGPALIIINNTEYVAGVASYGDPTCTRHGCSTKVDAYEAFINNFIGNFLQDGQACLDPALCYSGFCVDGFCCQTACNGPCVSCDSQGDPGSCQPVADGQACHDSDPCNGDETCQAGQCSPGTSLDCSVSLPCQVGSCQAGSGCVLNPVADGTACDNQDVCDGPDQCLGGQCQSIGPALECTDADPCTSDLCDPLAGCISPPAPDGTSCTNHDPCDGDETCRSGVCTPGDPLDCDDQNSCTIDSCVPALRCKHEPFPDGDNCGRCGKCLGGVCEGDQNCSSGCSTARPTRTVSLLAFLMLILSIFVCRKRSIT